MMFTLTLTLTLILTRTPNPDPNPNPSPHPNPDPNRDPAQLYFEYGLQPYVRRVRVSDVASVPVEIYSCFGGTVSNTAVDGLPG